MIALERGICMGFNKTKLVIAYTGPAVDEGMMDIRDLGPALMALGDFINGANKIVNHDNSTIAVNVHADFQKGSFEIHLELVRTIVEQLQSLFTTAVSVEELMNYLGMASTIQSLVGLPNLLDLIRWAKAHKIKKAVKNNDNTVTITGENGTTIIVHANVVNIYQSVPVRESLEKMVEPLEREGIDSFEVRKTGEKTVTEAVITKEEKESFILSKDDLAIKDELIKRTYESWVKILKVDFEELKWRFKTDSNKFYATVEDKAFLDKIESGDIVFSKGDSMKVLLEETQEYKADANTIKSEYKVLEVLEYRRRAREVELPFEE